MLLGVMRLSVSLLLAVTLASLCLAAPQAQTGDTSGFAESECLK
jgi:hypothetical protein